MCKAHPVQLYPDSVVQWESCAVEDISLVWCWRWNAGVWVFDLWTSCLEAESKNVRDAR